MNTQSIVWLKNGRIFKQVENTVQIINNLPKKVYNLQYNERTNELYLEEFSDEFHFNFKVYGMETQFIDHVMKTYEGTKSNLGILLNGVKGTGKTITAKIIANKTNLPVIMVNKPYLDLAEFISKINSPCVLFFDEYEKNFKKDKENDTELLSIMDGVLNSKYRRVFLLTTNNPWVNENMIGRPSRIRYKKSFNNLQSEVIIEYLKDNLNNKDYIPEIIEFIDTLAISTIDILKAIVEELNIHEIPISQWKHMFNVENARYSWYCKIKETDEDDTTDDEPYNVEQFIKDLESVGKTVKKDDGSEHTISDMDLSIYYYRVNTSSNVEHIQVGEDFGRYGKVIEPINDKGILVTEDEDNTRSFIKVLNLNNKPSLYRGKLAF